MQVISKEQVLSVLDWVYKARKMILATIILSIWGSVMLKSLGLVDPELVVQKASEIATVVVAFYFLTSKAGDSEKRLIEAYEGPAPRPYESVFEGPVIEARELAPVLTAEAVREIVKEAVAEMAAKPEDAERG